MYPDVDQQNVGQQFMEPRVVYRNLGNGKFREVSKEIRSGITARHSSRGCFGDYDGNVYSFVFNNMNELPSLLRNDGGHKDNWIKIKLIETTCNRTVMQTATGKRSA